MSLAGYPDGYRIGKLSSVTLSIAVPEQPYIECLNLHPRHHMVQALNQLNRLVT